MIIDKVIKTTGFVVDLMLLAVAFWFLAQVFSWNFNLNLWN